MGYTYGEISNESGGTICFASGFGPPGFLLSLQVSLVHLPSTILDLDTCSVGVRERERERELESRERISSIPFLDCIVVQ
jgi:hypothetical protein